MFELIHTDKNTGARAGKLRTAHGTIDTPAFMPVATKATVKTLAAEELYEMGTQVLISNAFHLFLAPGMEVIKRAGGLHEFMHWRRVIFTDSGGFQMIRKDFPFKITDEGITYKNPRDGKKYSYTPQICLENQKILGSDVAMILDECPTYGSEYSVVEASVKRTVKWAQMAKMLSKKKGSSILRYFREGHLQN